MSSASFGDWEIAQFLLMWARSRPKWYDQAACRGKPTEYFFPGVGQSAFIKRGQEICATCPVKEKCFRQAYDAGDEHGCWGGSLPAQRRQWLIEDRTTDDAWDLLKLAEVVPDISD